MSRISAEKFQRIAEAALGVLVEKYPLPLTTRAIARELARDNEFAGKILRFLEEKKLVERAGKGYARWVKWRLTPAAAKQYKAMG